MNRGEFAIPPIPSHKSIQTSIPIFSFPSHSLDPKRTVNQETLEDYLQLIH